MKFCAVICEYNPFHNGHKYQLAEARRLSGCDKLLCIMSGNFTQRGEPAVFHKYERARHAVLGGADAVIELPAAFAVAPAEVFARGAIHILASLPAVSALAFGCESGTKEDFLKTARALLSESKQFKATLKENMKDGTSYIRARNAALLASGADVDEALLSSPNNILGTEYCRAILSEGSAIGPIPVPRVGGGYADTALFKDFSSATALRAAMLDGSRKAKKALKNNLPEYVRRAALGYKPTCYETAALCAILSVPAATAARCTDCAARPENHSRSMARTNPDFRELLPKVVSKRYTYARIRRVLAQNFLGIDRDSALSYAHEPLYIRTLAVKKEGAEETLAALSAGKFPLIARKSDYSLLKKDALACFETDVRANDLYNALSGRHTGDFETMFV